MDPSIPVPFALRIPHPSVCKHEVMKQLGHGPQLQGTRLETAEQVCRVVWVSVEGACWRQVETVCPNASATRCPAEKPTADI